MSSLRPTQLLIGFETGVIALWDMAKRSVELRAVTSDTITSISWHSEGRQFVASHRDGSISTWNLKAFGRPASTITPHAKVMTAEHKPESCHLIPKVEWRTQRGSNDAFLMFTGGMPTESVRSHRTGHTNSQVDSKQVLTIVYGKSTTVLEMEHNIIDFITLCESPYENDFNDPYAIVLLLTNDLVVVDLQTPG